jgi:hypothetical protein
MMARIGSPSWLDVVNAVQSRRSRESTSVARMSARSPVWQVTDLSEGVFTPNAALLASSWEERDRHLAGQIELADEAGVGAPVVLEKAARAVMPIVRRHSASSSSCTDSYQ